MNPIIQSITALINFMSDSVYFFAEFIVGKPLLLAFVLVSFVGLGVGLIKRIIRF